jgi:hypothetical protein
MAAVSIPPTAASSLPAPARRAKSSDWTSILAAATLAAGGALLVTGHRRTGLAVAAAGTALAVLEEREFVAEWWKRLPGYLEEAQQFLEKVEDCLQEATVQGQKLQSALHH